MNTLLQTKKVTYSYEDGTLALDQVSISLRQGSSVAILGRNGAGKSTLFCLLNGILRPTAGDLFFKGQPLDYSKKGLLSLRKAVGIVFQDPDTQLFSANVYQEISFGPLNLKLSEEEVHKRVQTAMQQVDILHLKDKPTHALSFGQKKRVAIAGVLAMQPEVLILDEPTAGLDPLGVSELMHLLKKLQQELGLSILIATHDMDIVPLYCDYAYVLDQGNCILEGTPKEIFNEPQKIRSAHLRLPRIGHLIEILSKKDGFIFTENANTISEARRIFRPFKKNIIQRK
jgi:cobalt/nickel transport system ATP-binding protein